MRIYFLINCKIYNFDDHYEKYFSNFVKINVFDYNVGQIHILIEIKVHNIQ